MEQIKQPAPAPGEIIAGRYLLKERLAEGGGGEVWVAEHCHLKQDVAVKFLKEDLLGDGNHATGVLERFRFESQVSAMLARRTMHVVAVHDAGDSEFGPFLAMEYVPGGSLSNELRVRGPMQPERLAAILDQIADALGAAHAAGIVHRDLKPANILVCDQPDGSPFVKVADFGIAKTTNQDLLLDLPRATSAMMLVGTPDFMSPEQLRRGVVQPATDIWALGVTCYKLLLGKLPFKDAAKVDRIVKVLSEPFLAPSTIRPELPVALDAWFLRALAKEPADRFVSVKEMSDAYREAIGCPVSRPVSFALTSSGPDSAGAAPPSERGASIARSGRAVMTPLSERATADLRESGEDAVSAELVPTQAQGRQHVPRRIGPLEPTTLISERAATPSGLRVEPTRPGVRRRGTMAAAAIAALAAGLLVVRAPNDPAPQRVPTNQAAQPADLESTGLNPSGPRLAGESAAPPAPDAVPERGPTSGSSGSPGDPPPRRGSPARLTNTPPAPAPAMTPRRSAPPNRDTLAAFSEGKR